MESRYPASGGRRLCALAVIALGLCAGCVQRSAPVVDSPVWDGAPKRPAPSAKPASPSAPAPGTAATPPGTAASRSSAAAASSSAPAPASSASSAASSPSPAPAPRADSPAARASGDAEALPEFYSVRKGDTLYSIALDNGQDYKDVAAWNGLTDANLIRVDQQLRVRPPPGWSEPAEDDGGVVARPVSPPSEIQARPLEAPPVKKTPKALKARYSEQALAQMRGAPFKPVPEPAAPAANVPPGAPAGPQAAPSTARARPATAETPTPAPKPAAAAAAATTGEIAWAWPARGAVLQAFNQGPNPKGIAIGGEPGQPVLASAAGKVVYSGSGLRGYGKLVIIKHDATYLSVYAHNRELRVKEGERVARGQTIAEMGSFDAERPGVHFEIRRLGKPVDPLLYLPVKGG